MKLDFKKIDAGKIATVVLLIVLAVFAIGAVMNRSPESPSAVGKKFILPEGRQVYHISQAEETWPKFVEAIIDPVDVHVGNTQKLSVVVDDDAEIVSVEAHIETDNDVVILPLEFVRQTESAASSIEETGEKNIFKEFLRRFQSTPKQRGMSLYEGEWIVKDTHDSVYHTVFLAKDVAGRENSITLAWSDACGIPMGGNATLSSNCSISTADGVDNGNLTINGGVTLTLNAPFAFNSGKTITVNGAIALGEDGALRKTNIWMVDFDNDTYPANATQYLQDTAPTNGKRRNTLNSGGIDCNDNSASVYPGTVTTGSCSCNYSSSCDESASGTTTTSTCNADGTFSGGSGSCGCSRDTDGNYCGTGYTCSFCNRIQVTQVCSGGSCSGTGSETSLGCSTSCCQCCSDSDCSSGKFCNWIFICESCSPGSWSCTCNDGYTPSGSLGAGVKCQYVGGPETCLSRCSSHGGWSGSWSCVDGPC